MAINSLQETFKIIERKGTHDIPFEAIEYLYNHESCPEIEEKIYHFLKNAFKYHKINHAYNAPLWYAIVSENHLSEKLIEPMISAYTVKDNDAEWFNEQGLVTLGLLVEKFPEKAIPAVLETIKKQIKHKSKAPYLFLFEPIIHGYTKNYTNELIEILKDPNLYWPDSFIKLLVDLEIKEAIPVLKVMLTKLKKPKNFLEEHTIIEIEAAIKELETGICPYPESKIPYHKTRKPWKEHYKKTEPLGTNNSTNNLLKALDKDFDVDLQDILYAKPSINSYSKIGRNDPCPCGSGKKHKKCCLGKT